MNVKKTIASIAAIAMVASATSLAPVFTGASVAADETVATDGAAVPADTETPAETESPAETEADQETNENDGIMPLVAEDTPEHENHKTQGVDGLDEATGTGTLTVTQGEGEDAGKTIVNVTLTPADGKDRVEGTLQQQGSQSVENCHIVIPVDGFTAEGWSFESGYGFDDENNKEWNIADGVIRFWLPVADEGNFSIVLTKGEGDAKETKTFVVNISNKKATVDPGPEDPDVKDPVKLTGGANDTAGKYQVTLEITGDTTPDTVGVKVGDKTVTFTKGKDGKYTADIDIAEADLAGFKAGLELGFVGADNEAYTITSAEASKKVDEDVDTEKTDEEKVDEAWAIIADDDTGIVEDWDWTWLDVKDLEEWGAASVIGVFQEQIGELAEITDYTFEVGEDGLVKFVFTMGTGDYWIDGEVWIQCSASNDTETGGDDNNDDNNTTTTPAPAPVVSNNPVSSGSSDPVTVVSSPAEVTAARDKNVTVNAVETPVTAQMLKAFTKNKNTSTLTLQYTSALKLDIAKSDVSSTSADLDFKLSTKSFLSEKALDKLDGAAKIVQLEFTGSDDMSGVDKVTIKSKVGAKYIGQKVTIYEYKNGKLVKVGVAEVNGAGIVKFKTNHFGQFVIAVEE